MADVFSRYAPFIQDFIYEHGWESLRAIQVAAGDAIFNTDDNVLLCASTASGKTEAAFFPILTEFWENPPTSVGAIYIGPLKALINDQFERLVDLCAQADIPVWHWHGDVSASHKSRMIKNPSGILQITPESLEALLLHKHAAVARLFGDLRYVVIDEVHSLLRGHRGEQTLCLIERLSRMAGVNPRRIGLSATIGDPALTGQILAAGSGRGTVIPEIRERGRTWRLSMEHFFVQGPQAVQTSRGPRTEVGAAQASAGEQPLEAQPYMPVVGAQEIEALDVRVEDPERPCAQPGPASGAALAPAPDPGVSGGRSQAQAQGAGGPGEWEDGAPAPHVPLAGASDIAPKYADPGLAYVFEHTRDKKCLVFVNSREECETVTTTLRQYCEAMGEPDRFLIHHGNLSASYRETAEAAMKDDERQMTTCTTSTLELGIDIGRLERAFQIDAPFTVSSFLQRMGRTGRRGEPPEMWFVMREDPPEARAMLPESVPWKLLQGIALVQLYVEDHWVEPPRPDPLPYSLLYQQTMSTLASCGELSPAQLAQRVLTLSPFAQVSTEDFRTMLLHLLETDHLEQTEQGGLIVGLAGERVTNNFKFYAVFQDNEEYTVRSESQELGTLVMPPPVGERIAIAGHVWVVEEIDHRRHLLYCTQVKGLVPAYFGDCPGDIHTRVLERMRQALSEDLVPPYLMENAVARLGQARHVARNSGVITEPLVCLGGDIWALFPWLGNYAFLALERFLKVRCASQLGLRGMDPARPYFMQFKMAHDVGEADFYRVVAAEAAKPLDPMELVYPNEVPVFEKYDAFLPSELVRKGFAYGVLDVRDMLRRVRSWGLDGHGGGCAAAGRPLPELGGRRLGPGQP